MTMNLTMFLSLYPVVIVIYVIMFRMVQKGTMLFGVHLSEQLLIDERATRIKHRYVIEMILLGLVMLIIPICALFTTRISIQFTIWLLWFLVALALSVVPFVRANQAIMELKHQMMPKTDDPWQTPQYVETNIIHTVTWIQYLPQCIISILAPIAFFFVPKLLPLSIDFDVFWTYLWTAGTFAIMTILFFLVALWMDRMRNAVISADSNVNMSYNRARKNVWNRAWQWEAWLNTFSILGMLIAALINQHQFQIFMAVMLAEAILGLLIMLIAVVRLQKITALYEPRKQDVFERDDDEYWLFGIFYNNPYDKRSTVEKRFGTGITTNLSSTMGKVSIVVGILSIIWIPFLCVWLIMEDFTPMRITYQADVVALEHVLTNYQIQTADIKDVTLITTLPERRHKINGTGTDTMEKGRYSCKDYGKYYAFLSCENQAFLLIHTSDETYLISDETDEKTEELYQLLTK